MSNGIATVFTSVWETICNSYLEVHDPHFTLKVMAFSHFSEIVSYIALITFLFICTPYNDSHCTLCKSSHIQKPGEITKVKQ
jgi:hypothetical protein